MSSEQVVDSQERGALSAAALAELGVTRLLFAIHGASFPSDPEEDVGEGSPATRAAERLLAFVRTRGFTGVQLGPYGETSRDNASPYDSTIFSRAISSIPVRAFAADGAFSGLVGAAALAAAQGDGGERGDHRRAHQLTHALVREAWAAFSSGARAELTDDLARFRERHWRWLERDALFAALREHYGGVSASAWPSHGGDPLDATLWLEDGPARVARRRELARQHASAIEAYVFGQWIAHAAHARVLAAAGALKLELYADLQVGFSEGDAWSQASAFLPDYAMGAPPSRTNLEGQPWNYPVLDPAQARPGGAALELVRARADKTFAEYDSLRIDHPHGLVCPWVYLKAAADPSIAVREGARLFESPDLPDHPRLAAYALVTPAQLDRSLPRHADRWARELTPAQIERYAVFFDEIVAAAARHGRARDSITCEVLSTMPEPLRCVLARHQLGRWRVMQKANLDDVTDVYRTENARPEDWVMLGNHDTPSIFGLIRGWDQAKRAQWAAYLTTRLALAPEVQLWLAAEPGLLVAAMFAEALACQAQHAMVFFADLFGYEERFNVPGTVDDRNWSLRLPAAFAERYRERLASGAALCVPLALAWALRARGSTSHALIARLLQVAGAETPLPAAVARG